MNKQQEQQLYEIEKNIKQLKDNIYKNNRLSKNDIKTQTKQILSYNDEANSLRIQLRRPVIITSNLRLELNKAQEAKIIRKKTRKVVFNDPIADYADPIAAYNSDSDPEKIAAAQQIQKFYRTKTRKNRGSSIPPLESISPSQRYKQNLSKKKSSGQGKAQEAQQIIEEGIVPDRISQWEGLNKKIPLQYIARPYKKKQGPAQETDPEAALIQQKQRQREAEEAALIQQRQREAEEAALIQQKQRQREAEEAALIQQRQREAEEAALIQQRQRESEEAALIQQRQRESKEAEALRQQRQREAEEAALIQQRQREAESLRQQRHSDLRQQELKRLEDERRQLEEDQLQLEAKCLQNKKTELQKELQKQNDKDAIDELMNLYSEPVINQPIINPPAIIPQVISSQIEEESKEEPCLNEINDYIGIGIYTDKINNCYINAALQMLYQMCFFRNSLIHDSNLEELQNHRTDDIQEDAVFTLQSIFYNYSRMLAPLKEAIATEEFTNEYIPFDIINDLIAVIKRIKAVPPADPVTDDSQDDPTDLISNLLDAVDSKTNNMSNNFVFGGNNLESEKVLPFKYIYSLNINNTDFSVSNIYLSNVIENDNDVKSNLKEALTPDLPFFLPSQKYLIFNLNRRYFSVEEDRMKKNTYTVIPDPILRICEHKFVLRGALIHLGASANQGHYVYVTFSNNGNNISGLYNNQLIGIFKPDKFIYFNFIVKNGIAETSLPTINTNPQEHILEINTIKENVEKNGYIYLYERVDNLEPIIEEPIVQPIVEEPIIEPSEADTESWFKKLLNYLRRKKWFEQLLERMKRQEPVIPADMEIEIEGETPLIIPSASIAELELELQGEQGPSGKNCKDFFIKLIPLWLMKQDEPVVEATTENLEKEVTTFSRLINQVGQGTKYINAISNLLTKVNKQPLTRLPPNFGQTVLDGIILAKNILNIQFENSVTKNELRNNTNKLLFIIENNSIPNSNNRKKLIKMAYNFLIEIPEKLTKMSPILQLNDNNNTQEGIELKRREKERKEKEINAFLSTVNWKGLKKLLDLMDAEKYKELNLKDTTIVLRSRYNNKTMKNLNNTLCMKNKSGNICKEIGQLTPLIITKRGYPSQIHKLTRKARLEIVDKNVKDRKGNVEKERERIEKDKITTQLQNQIKSLENLKEKVNFINNEDIKKQIDFYTRKLTKFNDMLLDPDDTLTDVERKEIANILTRTIEIQKDLQEKLERNKGSPLEGGNHFTRRKNIHLQVRKNKTRSQ